MSESPDYPVRIYKYVPPERIDILQSLTIRFTQPSQLNDDFDLKPLFSQMMKAERLKKELDSSDKFKEMLMADLKSKYFEQPLETRQQISLEQFFTLSLVLVSQPKILDNTISEVMQTAEPLQKVIVPIVRERLIQALSQLGVLSLSSSGTNSTMWAHYADYGKGLAYEFDASHGFFHQKRIPSDPMLQFPNNDMLQLRGVRYCDHDPLSQSFIDLDGIQILFTKQEAWEHQAEWRVVAPLGLAKTKLVVDGQEIYLFEIPASAITRVIVGAKASKDFMVKIKAIIRSRPELWHVEMAQIHVNLTSHRLDVVPITE